MVYRRNANSSKRKTTRIRQSLGRSLLVPTTFFFCIVSFLFLIGTLPSQTVNQEARTSWSPPAPRPKIRPFVQKQNQIPAKSKPLIQPPRIPPPNGIQNARHLEARIPANRAAGIANHPLELSDTSRQKKWLAQRTRRNNDSLIFQNSVRQTSFEKQIRPATGPSPQSTDVGQVIIPPPAIQTPSTNLTRIKNSNLLRGQASPQDEFEIKPRNSASVQFENSSGFVTMIARNASVGDVLSVLAEKENLSFVLAEDAPKLVSFSLQKVPASEALSSILGIAGYTWSEQGGIIYVSPNTADPATISPEFSGKIVKVFSLDFISAEETNKVVTGMLSSAGKSYVSSADPTNYLKTGDQIVVEDLPGVIHRIENYIKQIDQPPRQVIIEAHVMEIDLDEKAKHGVNFETLAGFSSNNLKLGTLGVDPTGTSTFFAELTAPKLEGLIDALKVGTDARTLASPQLMVVNGQESRLQVGAQLGFRVITTTQTATLEEVKFLDVGVVLSVTPRIGRDGRILMKVKPEVSTGEINIETGLPEEETSEVETSVLLSSGKGMVIGGLIQEKDSISVSKVPILGDLRYVGGLFRRTQKEKSRTEIVFVLIPRIVERPETSATQDTVVAESAQQRRLGQYLRATTSLFAPIECQQQRPWFDPELSQEHSSIVLGNIDGIQFATDVKPPTSPQTNYVPRSTRGVSTWPTDSLGNRPTEYPSRGRSLIRPVKK